MHYTHLETITIYYKIPSMAKTEVSYILPLLALLSPLKLSTATNTRLDDTLSSYTPHKVISVYLQMLQYSTAIMHVSMMQWLACLPTNPQVQVRILAQTVGMHLHLWMVGKWVPGKTRGS